MKRLIPRNKQRDLERSARNELPAYLEAARLAQEEAERMLIEAIEAARQRHNKISGERPASRSKCDA